MKILILGAGVYQLPLIRRAREMGLETVVASTPGKYPGIAEADLFHAVDTTDAGTIVRIAREHDVAGVATTGTDVAVPALGAVVDALQLSGPDESAAIRAADKCRMKEALVAAGVPGAPFVAAEDERTAHAWAARHGFPVMVKAADSSGSRGVSRVSDPGEMAPAWQRAVAASRNKRVLVERCLDGTEFGAQAVVHGERVVEVLLHGDTVTTGPVPTPLGHSLPSALPERARSAAAQTVEDAVHALGLRDCIANVDLMLAGEGPFVIEIGARMGGTCIPEILNAHAGFDAYAHVLHLALGGRPEDAFRPERAAAARLLASSRTGTLRAVRVPDDARAHPDLVEITMDVAAGDEVRRFEVGPDRVGHVVVTGHTAAAAEETAAHLADRVELDVDA